MNMICIFCGEEVKEDKFILALEKPYMNLWVHRYCERDCDNIREFLEKNLEKYLELYNKQKKRV